MKQNGKSSTKNNSRHLLLANLIERANFGSENTTSAFNNNPRLVKLKKKPRELFFWLTSLRCEGITMYMREPSHLTS